MRIHGRSIDRHELRSKGRHGWPIYGPAGKWWVHGQFIERHGGSMEGRWMVRVGFMLRHQGSMECLWRVHESPCRVHGEYMEGPSCAMNGVI